VYRRRRLALFIVLVIVVAGVWLLIARPWEGTAEATEPGPTQSAEPLLPVVSGGAQQSPTPGSSGTPTPGGTEKSTPTPDPTASAAPCATDDLEVKAVTDKTSYASGQDPKLSIELTNAGSAACTLNVGTSAQVFTVTSGSDTWWTSTDCQSQPSDMVVLLKAGQKVSSAEPLTWDRTRSSVATCDAKNRPSAPGGGATYHLSVSIGGVSSIDDALFQLY
jgi:hypothetical protein